VIISLLANMFISESFYTVDDKNGNYALQ